MYQTQKMNCNQTTIFTFSVIRKTLVERSRFLDKKSFTGKSIVILGMGAVGQNVARMLEIKK